MDTRPISVKDSGRRHPREDHHLGAGGASAGHRRARSLVPRRRGDREQRGQLPGGEGTPCRGRGRRVRHRLLRQGSQVPALPAADGHLHQHGAGPRRHLPGRGALRLGLRPLRGPAPRGRAARGERRLARRRRPRPAVTEPGRHLCRRPPASGGRAGAWHPPRIRRGPLPAPRARADAGRHPSGRAGTAQRGERPRCLGRGLAPGCWPAGLRRGLPDLSRRSPPGAPRFSA